MGHVNRHFFAPRAATQDAMNLKFQGTEYELAERYTDMTKILFLCLWYCSIFPGSFFLCSFSLGIKYYVDKFCLMRSWKKAPQLGPNISQFSRRYFFTVAIAVMAIISSYYWSGFPFDNICPNNSINATYLETITILPANETNVSFAFDINFEEDIDYHFCNQDFMAMGSGPTFPFVPTMSSETTDPAMWSKYASPVSPLHSPELLIDNFEYPFPVHTVTDDQILTTTYFGWAAVGILAIGT